MAPTTGSRRRGRRAILVLATTATVLGGSPSALPAVASAAVVDPSASYVLVNRNSGKALDVYELATGDGAQVVQWPDTGGTNQQWRLVRLGASAGTFTNPIKRNGPDP